MEEQNRKRTLYSEELIKMYLQAFDAGPSDESDNCGDESCPQSHYYNNIVHLLG